MTSLLRVEELSITLPTAAGMLRAVRSVSLSIRRGEVVCLVGESGCGKSMTAMGILGLLPRAAQRQARAIEFDGQDLVGMPAATLRTLRGNRMAVIFQDPMASLNPTKTVGSQLTEVVRRHRGADRKTATDRAVALLQRVGITGAAKRLGQYPHQFSGGQRQRIMIAMALMCEPELLIADEPTTALDVTIQAEILGLLMDLKDEFGLALLLISHDLGVVSRVADSVIVMYAGEVVEQGSVEAVFSRPAHPYTRGLLASLPARGTTPRRTHLGAIPGIVPSIVGPVASCCFIDRCTFRQPSCADAAVALRPRETGHDYRCILTPDDRDGGAGIS